MRNPNIRTAALAVAFFQATLAAEACSLLSCLNHGQELRHEFHVVITHKGTALQGAKVEIRGPHSTVKISGFTNTNGVFKVAGLRPGSYWIESQISGVHIAAACFHIRKQASSKAAKVLTYELGSHATVRSPRGRVIDVQAGKGGSPLWNALHHSEVPVHGATLSLHELSGKEIQQTRSGADGLFEIDGVQDGTYVLRLVGGMAAQTLFEEGEFVIEVSSSAGLGAVKIERHPSSGGSCGGLQIRGVS